MERIPKIENKKESEMNLDNLSFDFCSDESIEGFYKKKLDKLNDREGWLAENEVKLKENESELLRAVEMGIIPDSEPETVRQYKLKKFENTCTRVIEIKKDLEESLKEIEEAIASRLVEFLPDWSVEKIKVVFIMNERADFCVDNGIITADLGRLVFSENYIEKVKKGLTHEVFHVWMFEKNDWSDLKLEEASGQRIKEQILFKTIDEGLAVLVSGQSLKDHHEKQGKDYSEYTKESFATFEKFQQKEDRNNLIETRNREFKNMGRFYVVGNEIVKAVYDSKEFDEFRKIMIEARTNPGIFLDEYTKLING